MMKLKYILAFSSLFFLFACNPKTNAIKKKHLKTNALRPNIIMILCDDLGYADVGFNGSKDIVTPHLDELAKNGTVYSSAYVPHPFCGPSRAGIMTGRYPHKFGSQFNLMMNSGELIGEGIPLSETFISTVLQKEGYQTAVVGKWHLGAARNYHPHDRGFDDFYGFLGGGHKYFPHQYQPMYENQVKQGNKLINDYLKPLEHNKKIVKETEYITDALSREAIRFLNDSENKDDVPFFLYLAYNAPHSPLEAKEEDLAKFASIKDVKRRTYAAMVHAVDRGIGRLIDALKVSEELDNTLIVFYSDNGGKLILGADNTPLREGKGSTCEGGFRVPMMMHYPNQIPSGKVFEHPISALDFYPTFARLAGANLPDSKKLDGKDIWDDITIGKNPRKGELIYVMRHREGYTDVGLRQDEWKALKTKQNKWKLYNLSKDIGEQNDLSVQFPDKVKSMVSKGEQWSKSHIEPRWFDPVSLEKDWKEKNMAKFKETFVITDSEKNN